MGNQRRLFVLKNCTSHYFASGESSRYRAEPHTVAITHEEAN